MNLKNGLKLLFNFNITFFILIFIYGCAEIPGINKSPREQSKSKKSISGYLSINDIAVDIIKINKLNENEIENYNKSKIDELNYSVSKFSNIYNYKYEYALGSSDVISINLTDTDDIDGSYTIDPNGDIDIPFIGKIKIEDLTLDETKNILSKVLIKYYRNTDITR